MLQNFNDKLNSLTLVFANSESRAASGLVWLKLSNGTIHRLYYYYLSPTHCLLFSLPSLLFLSYSFFKQYKFHPNDLRCWDDIIGTQLLLSSHRVMSNAFATPWTLAHQAPLSMGFPRQEYWSGLPFSSPGDFPKPGIEPRSPCICRRILHHWATSKALLELRQLNNWLRDLGWEVSEANLQLRCNWLCHIWNNLLPALPALSQV